MYETYKIEGTVRTRSFEIRIDLVSLRYAAVAISIESIRLALGGDEKELRDRQIQFGAIIIQSSADDLAPSDIIKRAWANLSNINNEVLYVIGSNMFTKWAKSPCFSENHRIRHLVLDKIGRDHGMLTSQVWENARICDILE